MKKKLCLTLTMLLTTMAGREAAALDTFMMNGRSAAMGGAGVACTTDATAQYYNPATFGFFSRKPAPVEGEEEKAVEPSALGQKSWGVDINAGAGARIHGEMGDYMETLANVDFDELSDDGIENEEDVRTLIKIAKSLSGIDDERNAFSAQTAGNVAARIGHVGVGVYGMAQASGRVLSVDTTSNYALEVGSLSTISDDIEAANPSVASNGSYTYQVFTSDQRTALTTAGFDIEAVRVLDNMAAAEGVTSAQVGTVIDILETVASSSTPGGSGSLDDNETTVLVKGFGVAEVPISYGYALNDNWAIGGNIKYMKGRVYGTSIRVFDDNNDEALEEVDNNYKETSTFGVDMGIMARYGSWQFGLVGRNLNSPKFDGFTYTPTITGLSGLAAVTVDDVKIKPQATAGVAWLPLQTLTLAVDLDLTANETDRTNYSTQFIRGGLEWDVFKVLALRVGAYSNLDESDIGVVYTAGLGLNLWAMRLDVAGAYAADEVNFDGDEVPAEANVMARLAIDF